MIADPVSAPSATGGTNRPRLLVADCSEDSRLRLGEYFRARGYEVLLAADGVEAIARAVTHHLDIVVMNATLPGLEGYEAAALVRKLRPQARIVLTTEADLDTRPRESERREVFRCFPAPFDLDAIARALESGGDTLTEPAREEGR